jgi:hypothetical protein
MLLGYQPEQKPQDILKIMKIWFQFLGKEVDFLKKNKWTSKLSFIILILSSSWIVPI